MTKKPNARKEIKSVVIAILDLLDCGLPPRQRHIAEQIYDLANELEYDEQPRKKKIIGE